MSMGLSTAPMLLAMASVPSGEKATTPPANPWPTTADSRRSGASRAAQVGNQLLRRGVAVLRALGEALEAHGGQVGRDSGRQRGRLLLGDLAQQGRGLLGVERLPAGEHLVEDGTQPIHVGPHVGFLA